MDDFELAFAPDSTDIGDNGQAQGTPEAPGKVDGSANATDITKETKPDSTTASPDAKATAKDEELKGALSKELEPYKSILDSRKWDPSKPDFAPTVLKSYQEAEAYAKRNETTTKLTQQKNDDLGARLRGDVDAINKYRESQGLSPIATSRPLAERRKEYDDITSHLNNILNGKDESGESFKALDSHFSKQKEEMLLEGLRQKANPDKMANDTFTQRKSLAQSNFANVVSQNKEATAFFDELSDHLSPGGLFDSMGIDVLDAAGTPERLNGFIELGQALHVFRNLDKLKESWVTSELERRRGAGNASPNGKASKGKAAQNDMDLDPISAAFLNK